MAWSTVKKREAKGKPVYGKAGSNGSAAPPFTLVFLDSARNIAEGTELSLEASYVSLGRNSECLVCYGEDFPMVSRLHAAIEWTNGSFSVSHLSSTNQTLLNGRPISRKWFLQDGDVIQLAPSGPKLRFRLAEQQSRRRGKVDLYQLAIVAVVLVSVLLLAWLLYSIVMEG